MKTSSAKANLYGNVYDYIIIKDKHGISRRKYKRICNTCKKEEWLGSYWIRKKTLNCKTCYIKIINDNKKTYGKNLYRQAKSAEDYLNQRLDKSGDCWIWVKGKDRGGYGQCHASKYAKKLGVTRAHQMAHVVWNGKIPKGKIVCHKCDNPSCCNPNHLYAGTWKSNVHDCLKRGRYRNGVNPKVDYNEILKYKGKKTCFQVSKKYNISFSRVCQIWRGEYSVNYR